jgi:hypothetical protein
MAVLREPQTMSFLTLDRSATPSAQSRDYSLPSMGKRCLGTDNLKMNKLKKEQFDETDSESEIEEILHNHVQDS